MKNIAILGSTGSIGTQALDVIARHKDRFKVVGLAAGRNTKLLREQAAAFHPAIATTIDDGPDALRRVAIESNADIVLAATDGFVSFDAVFAAVERGIDIAVANKELIVSAGELLMQAAARSGSQILPVDSEHSAIFQCLAGEDRASIATIVLTASGGPFWRLGAAEIANATVDQALTHPTWQMGAKNTIDSATMMNKGLEIIEAARLFGVTADRLEIVVHPQSIAHGFVVFTDGSVKAQLCVPDMRIPIGYALAYPTRLPLACHTERSDTERSELANEVEVERSRSADVLSALGSHPEMAALRYDFERPDFERFPCLRLAYEALARGGVVPAVLSAANEVAVEAFLAGRLSFGRIPILIEEVMQQVPQVELTLATVRSADREARKLSAAFLEHSKTATPG